MKISSRLLCLSLVLVGLFLRPCGAEEYALTLLTAPPGHEHDFVSFRRINASGQIIGSTVDRDTDDALGFVYSGGTYTVFSPINPGDRNTHVYDINDAGVATFVSSRFWGGDPSGVYTYAGGVVTDLNLARTEGPILINNAGQIAYTQYSPGANGFAYLRTGDTAQSLGTVPGANASQAIALNNLGQVVGGANNNHAILWNGSAMVDLGTLPFAASSSARAVNDAGTVVGSSSYQPFIFKDGVMSVLFEVPNGSAEAYGINNHGAVVGSTYHNDDTGTAWLYENGVLTDLSTLLPLSINGAPGFLELYYAADINDAGQIIGAGEWIDESGDVSQRGFLLTPVAVPEPTTCALLLVTMIALGPVRVRRVVAGGFAALFCGFGALGETIDSYWTGAVSSDYFNAGNWTNGVPNNGGDKTYRAFLPESSSTAHYTPSMEASGEVLVSVDAFTIENGYWSDLSVGPSVSLFTKDFSNQADWDVFSINIAGLIRAENFVQNVNGVLTSGAYWIIGGTLEWRNARIETIASHASVVITGKDAVIRDSVTGQSALAPLSRNEGALSIQFRSGATAFKTAGDLSNRGSLNLHSSDFTIDGDLAENVKGELIAGSLNLYYDSTLSWEGAEIHTIGKDASIELFWNQAPGTGIRNSLNGANALAGLSRNAGYFSVGQQHFVTTSDFVNEGHLEFYSFSDSEWTFTTAGAFSNPGTISVTNDDFALPAYHARIEATLTENVDGVLTAGGYFLYPYTILSWRGAKIEVIGENAAISLDKEASIRDNLTGTDALAGLKSNLGKLGIRFRSFETAGDFSNLGTIRAEGSGAIFTINGKLAQNQDGVLTAGSLHADRWGTIEWEGAEIHTIEAGASIRLDLDGVIRDSLTGKSALAGLAINRGKLAVYDRGLEITGSLANSGDLTLQGGAFVVPGSLTLNPSSVLEIGFSPDWDEEEGIDVFVSGSIAVAGDITLGGTLRLNLANVDLLRGKMEEDYLVFSTDGEIFGEFQNVLSGDRLESVDGKGSFLVRIDGDGVWLSDFQTVPEPGKWALILLGVGALLAGRRRAR